MPFDAAHEKLTTYMAARGKDPGPSREARSWYADQYGSIQEMADVWNTDAENAAWSKIYNGADGRQVLGPLGATRRQVGWTALGRRDHFAQFLSDGGKQMRAADLRVRHPMLRARWGTKHLQRIMNIITKLLGKTK